MRLAPIFRDMHASRALVLFAACVVLSIAATEASSRIVIGSGGMSGTGLYSVWAAGYLYSQDLVSVEYDTVGTADGLDCYFGRGECDFAGLDYGLDDETQGAISNITWNGGTHQQQSDGNQVPVYGSAVLQLPVAALPYVFAYRLDAVSGGARPLALSGPLVARMWMGEIADWSHPDLVALNPSLASAGNATPITLVYEDSIYGSTALLGATLDLLHLPFAAWRKALISEQEPSSNITWCAAASLPHAVGRDQGVMLAKAAAVNGAVVFASYGACNGQAGLRAASMRNPAGATVLPTTASVAAALDDFAPQVSAATPQTMYRVLPVGGNGSASWPMTAFALVGMSADIRASDCSYVSYVLDFIGWTQLNQQAGTVIGVGNAFVPVPPRFAKNALDLMGTVRCNGVGAFDTAFVIGSGSPMPAYTLWAYEYAASNVTVHYTETTGGRGKTQILAGDVDFGTANNDVTADVHLAYPDLVVVPVGAYPVVFCYNVPGLMGSHVPSLVLSLNVTMGILLAQISRWNDPRIVALNPDLALPAADILFVGKTGSSINTGTLSRAYALIDPTFNATYGTGNAVAWPVASTNRSVNSPLSEYVDTLKTTPYAIAYTAHYVVLQERNLREARLLNAAGTTALTASRDTTLAALEEVVASRGGLAGLDRMSFVVGATGPNAWPLNSLCLVMIHTTSMTDAPRATELLRWLYWTQTSSQAQHVSNATGVYGIASVPDVWSTVLSVLVNVTVGGVHVNTLYPCFANGTLCSNAGTCSESLGRCECDPGRAGAWCESMAPSDTGGDSLSASATAAVIAGALGGTALCAVFALGCVIIGVSLLVRRNQGRRREDWEIDSHEIDLSQAPVLGTGGYGTVYKATWRGADVAVKVLSCTSLSSSSSSSSSLQGRMGRDAVRSFGEEVRVMTALRHPNVVLFMAACTKPPNMCIVMEYMALGSLHDLLHNELVVDLPIPLVIKMAYQAAKGMYFLHSSGIAHCDLKSLNLLLDNKWNVKVSDFGLTRFKTDMHAADQAQGTVQWVAPEVLEESPDVDYTQADVYAFGIVLWEMISRRDPYEGMTPAAVAVAVIRHDHRPAMPPGAPADYAALATECWQRDRVMRPSFMEIMQRLNTMLDGGSNKSGSARSTSTSNRSNADGSNSSNSSSSGGAIGSAHRRAVYHGSDGDNGAEASWSSAPNRSRRIGEPAPCETPIGSGGSATLRNANTIVVADVAGAASLWKANAVAMRDATLLYNTIVRRLIAVHNGAEIALPNAHTTGDGSFGVVFGTTGEACAWCVAVQSALVGAAWPKTLLQHPLAAQEFADNDDKDDSGNMDRDDGNTSSHCRDKGKARAKDGHLIYAGLRVRMAVHTGGIRRTHSGRDLDSLPVYSGPGVDLCCRLAALARGGRVLLSHQAALDCAAVDSAHTVCVGTLAMSDTTLDMPASDDDGNGQAICELCIDGFEGRRFETIGSVRNIVHDDSGHHEGTSADMDVDSAPKATTIIRAPKEDDFLGSANLCEWVIPYGDLEVREKIGMGSYGVVYHAKWKGIDVAVKRFANQRLDERRRLDFRAEAATMSLLRHPYVVSFMGACVMPPNLCIVTEHVRRGSMRSVLDGTDAQRIGWHRRMRMLSTAAMGVAYLHGLAEPGPIIHRDLKSSNLLVADDYTVKVGDFGFSRIKEANATMTRCGTPCWTAPEIITGGKYDEKVDVYSFGIVVWEVLTHRRPFADRAFADVALAVVEGKRPPVPASCPAALRSLMEACWHADPTKRPSMEDVVTRLDAIAVHVDRDARHRDSDHQFV